MYAHEQRTLHATACSYFDDVYHPRTDEVINYERLLEDAIGYAERHSCTAWQTLVMVCDDDERTAAKTLVECCTRPMIGADPTAWFNACIIAAVKRGVEALRQERNELLEQ